MNDLYPLIGSVLKTTAERWRQLAEELPAHVFSRKPNPDRWSAQECLQHQIDTEKVFSFRVQCFLEGRDFPNFDPDTEGSKSALSRSAREMVEEFQELRAVAIEAIRNLSNEDMHRSARHSELGPVTLQELLYEWAGHDLIHLAQANRSLMQLFILNSGAWQTYYTKYLY